MRDYFVDDVKYVKQYQPAISFKGGYVYSVTGHLLEGCDDGFDWMTGSIR